MPISCKTNALELSGFERAQFLVTGIFSDGHHPSLSRKENERFALGNILTFGLFQVMLHNDRVFSKDVNEREIIGNVKQAN